jgi:hypothetical protein
VLLPIYPRLSDGIEREAAMGGYGAGILLGIVATVSLVVSLVICYAVMLVKNSKRDVYHQIPILKAFLYSLIWTPVVLISILLMLKMTN